MTDVTEDLDRLDAVVFEFFRAMQSAEEDWFSQDYRGLEAALMSANPGMSSRSAQAMLSSRPQLAKLYSRACDRQRSIVAGRMDRFLESRAMMRDEAHSVVLGQVDTGSGLGADCTGAPALRTKAPD